MRRYWFLYLFLGLLAAFLGAASAWPLDGARAVWLASLRGCSLWVALFALLVAFPRSCSLPWQIFVAMVGGVLAGWLAAVSGHAPFVSEYLGIFGALFILLLKLVIVPLIFTSVLCGVAGIGDMRKLGALGVKTLVYFLCTTCIAVLIALALVNLLQPGRGRESLKTQVQEEQADAASDSLGLKIQNEMLPAVIRNPIMADENPIVVIFVALLIGAALATLGEEGKPAVRIFEILNAAFITVIRWVMYLAPIGVFALMARVIAELGLGYIAMLGKYCFTVLFGLAIHFCLLTCVLVPLFGRVSPLRFLRGMIPVFEVAFTTSSSAATLPVTLDCTTRRVGADRNIANFVLPLGVTINMDGTALYVAVASLFIAEVYGVAVPFQGQLMVFLTAVLVSVGAAGIPGASIGLLGIILQSIGAPIEGIAVVVGVDRLLDMSRTVVNVTGDSVGTVIISRSEGVMRD